MERSFKADENGRGKAKRALSFKGWTQTTLVAESGLSRTTVSKFFGGKAVDRDNFVKLCELLDLNFKEVADLYKASLDEVRSEELPPESHTIVELVKEVRFQIKAYVEERCSTIRILNMTQKIELDDIYTNVNILEKLTRDRQLRLEELLDVSRDDFERLARGEVLTKGVDGVRVVKDHQKLMVFGKPGAGKTTFLKFLALQCSADLLFSDLIPIFIPLKEWAENQEKLGLLEYLVDIFATYGIFPNTQVKHTLLDYLINRDRKSRQERVNLSAVEKILRKGKVFMLLDGLDEVRESDSKRVIKEIEEFSFQFPENRFVITCRIAAKDYVFEKFTEVEVSDFSEQQVRTFVNQWFNLKSLPEVAKRLLERLQKNQSISELTCSPIMLALLCLIFEESGELSSNRADLYKRGLDLLLSRWDASRGIERDRVYQNLSLRAKEEMLSEIAFSFFEKGEFFFRKDVVADKIMNCISDLPRLRDSQENKQGVGVLVLQAMEAQHGILVERANGIYSFSHLTFQEYLTALRIQNSRNIEMLNNTAAHVMDVQWREVIILTAGMLGREGIDEFLPLLQAKIEDEIYDNKKIQELLGWACGKSCSNSKNHSFVISRITYVYASVKHLSERFSKSEKQTDSQYGLDQVQFLVNAVSPNSEITVELDFDSTVRRILDVSLTLIAAVNAATTLANGVSEVNPHGRALAQILERARAFSKAFDTVINCSNEVFFEFNRIRKRSTDSGKVNIIGKLNHLADELPQIKVESTERDKQEYLDWWKKQEYDWISRLRNLVSSLPVPEHYWKFSPKDMQLLDNYLEASKLLAYCLSCDSYISKKIRLQVASKMFMPCSRIEEAGVTKLLN